MNSNLTSSGKDAFGFMFDFMKIWATKYPSAKALDLLNRVNGLFVSSFQFRFSNKESMMHALLKSAERIADLLQSSNGPRILSGFYENIISDTKEYNEYKFEKMLKYYNKHEREKIGNMQAKKEVWRPRTNEEPYYCIPRCLVVCGYTSCFHGWNR